jgi:hypothetical protein
VFVPATIAFIGTILFLDRFTNEWTQLVLGLATAVALVVACVPLTLERRLQVVGVVLVATFFELIGSIIWGVYRYRMHNLPTFVPPGHGLVFLLGLSISQLRSVERWPRTFVGLVIAGAVGWGVGGLVGLTRLDVLGALGILVFLVYLRFGPAPRVYAGVFIAVAMLELYGTAIGTWTWKPIVPGTTVASGNPPSGAIAGYAMFDICAMLFASFALRFWQRRRAPELALDSSAA